MRGGDWTYGALNWRRVSHLRPNDTVSKSWRMVLDSANDGLHEGGVGKRMDPNEICMPLGIPVQTAAVFTDRKCFGLIVLGDIYETNFLLVREHRPLPCH